MRVPRLGKRFRAMMRRREEALALQNEHLKPLDPLEWGLDLLGIPADADDPRRALLDYTRAAIADSDRFFALPAVPAFTVGEAGHVTYPSAIATEFPENNTVHATFHDTPKSRKRAVVVLGHWNAQRAEYDRIGAALARNGIGALRMSMPFHDERKPSDWGVARDIACSNLGRTIRAVRQAVLDARAGIEFLLQQGYHRIGLAGASVGSAVCMLLAAHDERIGALLTLHIASRYGAVLYQGRATRHVRAAFEGQIDRATLDAAWAIISPVTFIERFRGRNIGLLFISGKYDRVFHPSLSRELVDAFTAHDIAHDWRQIPCGHWTMAMFPFSAYVGATALRFFKRTLERGVAPRARA